MSKINDFDDEWRAWPIVVVIFFIFLLFLLFVAFVQPQPLQTILRSSPVSFVNNEQAAPDEANFKSREDLPDIRNIFPDGTEDRQQSLFRKPGREARCFSDREEARDTIRKIAGFDTFAVRFRNEDWEGSGIIIYLQLLYNKRCQDEEMKANLESG